MAQLKLRPCGLAQTMKTYGRVAAPLAILLIGCGSGAPTVLSTYTGALQESFVCDDGTMSDSSVDAQWTISQQSNMLTIATGEIGCNFTVTLNGSVADIEPQPCPNGIADSHGLDEVMGYLTLTGGEPTSEGDQGLQVSLIVEVGGGYCEESFTGTLTKES